MSDQLIVLNPRVVYKILKAVYLPETGRDLVLVLGGVPEDVGVQVEEVEAEVIEVSAVDPRRGNVGYRRTIGRLFV